MYISTGLLLIFLVLFYYEIFMPLGVIIGLMSFGLILKESGNQMDKERDEDNKYQTHMRNKFKPETITEVKEYIRKELGKE